MTVLTKYDVMAYLSNGAVTVDKLIKQVTRNAMFEKTSERRIKSLLAELLKDEIILKNKEITLTDKATNVLAFILWAKKDGIDYNTPLKKRNVQTFRKMFETREMSTASDATFSKPTMLKIARELEQNNFIKTMKKKPLVIKASVTDRTLFFANAFAYNFAAFQNNIKSARIEKDSPKLREHLIKLHVYSTTVTEGNTATEKDIERVLNNLDSKLSPKEVIEIINAKKAIDELCRIYKNEELSLDLIKRLHRILMTNLVENPGEISYTGKRVIGSPVKLPDSKIEIDTALEALLNFYANYGGKIAPLILAPLVHFIFVSVHPFVDGNGRVARLVHSFILMKAGLPLFAFNPDYRNTYFELLDKGRVESVEEFVQFCIDKHKELIEKL